MGTASPTGRSTRTFKAICERTHDIVFLKDTWRIFSDLQPAEHLVYQRLSDKKVEHIARCKEGADIEEHITKTQDVIRAEWAKHPTEKLRTLRHYRLVLKDVCRDLTSFETVKEFVTAMRDAIEGEFLSRVSPTAVSAIVDV
jgi:hypothetical protein